MRDFRNFNISERKHSFELKFAGHSAYHRCNEIGNKGIQYLAEVLRDHKVSVIIPLLVIYEFFSHCSLLQQYIFT
jgi:hypothetical protein